MEINVKNLNVKYDDNIVTNDVNFKLTQDKNTFIIGANGSGKSSVLKAIAGLVQYDGEIYLDDINILDLPNKKRAQKIGLFSQNSEFYFNCSVYDSLLIGRYPYKEKMFDRYNKEDHDKVSEVLEMLDLVELKDTPLLKLSGGQRQRALFGRLLVLDSDIILVDEVTNHLDFKYQIEIMELICNYAKEYNKILVCVLHDINLVNKYADNIVFLKEGNIIDYGKKEEVLNSKNFINGYGIDIKKWYQENLESWV